MTRANDVSPHLNGLVKERPCKGQLRLKSRDFPVAWAYRAGPGLYLGERDENFHAYGQRCAGSGSTGQADAFLLTPSWSQPAGEPRPGRARRQRKSAGPPWPALPWPARRQCNQPTGPPWPTLPWPAWSRCSQPTGPPRTARPGPMAAEAGGGRDAAAPSPGRLPCGCNGGDRLRHLALPPGGAGRRRPAVPPCASAEPDPVSPAGKEAQT